MAMVKLGKTYINGEEKQIYLVQGIAGKDAELKQAGRAMLGKVSVAAVQNADESTMWVTINGWRDRANDVGAISKGDSVMAIGTLNTREYNGKSYIDVDADFVCISGIRNGVATTKAAGSYAASNYPADPAAGFDELDEEAGDLPF